MKQIKILLIIQSLLFVYNTSFAQWTPSTTSTAAAISRTGQVTIGDNNPYGARLHAVNSVACTTSATTNASELKLTNTAGGTGNRAGIDFVTYSSSFRNARIEAIDMGNYNGSIAFLTKSNSTNDVNISEKMRLSDDGKLGIGVTPTKLLHLKGASPVMYLDATSGSPGIEIGSGATLYHDITYSSTAGGQLKIGPTNSSYRSIFLRASSPSGVVVFSTSPAFGYTGNPGLSGSYLFDGQASACSLMVASAGSSGSYPSIPSGGYIFNVQGGSNFNGRVNVNYSTSTTPDKTLAGLNICNTSTYYYIQTNKSKPLALNPDPHTGPSKDSSYVAIGFKPGDFSVPANYKLAVKGKIICEELKVKFAGLWSDYVFDESYKLRELNEVEKYIETNKHLPDVPSEVEIKENGIETGQMDATLLRKIEELTLYMIEMNKQIDQLKKENIELKQSINK